MAEKIRILFLSANPWTTSRIRVDKEAREIFEKLEEGRYRELFDLKKHAAIRPGDLQRLLMKHEPHIVHFSGHGSKTKRIILEGAPGRGKQVDPQGLVDVFRLYRSHLRLVVLNACFTRGQAQALTDVIDYSVGIGRAIGDRAGVTFAGAFYRALGFGRSVREAFESAKAELKLNKTPRSKGIELFVREGVRADEGFPSFDPADAEDHRELLPAAVRQLLAGDSAGLESRFVRRAMVSGGLVVKQTRERLEGGTKVLEKSVVSYFRLRC